jgi:hypothetical protein
MFQVTYEAGLEYFSSRNIKILAVLTKVFKFRTLDAIMTLSIGS